MKTFAFLNHIDRIWIELTGLNITVAVILIGMAIAFAIWYYHDTVPPVAGWKKWILVTMRATALAVLLIGLARPILYAISTAIKRSTMAVLIDTSASMNQKNDPQRKRDALVALAKIRSAIEKNSIFFGFDSHLRDLEDDKPSFTGTGTDILTALREAGNKHDISSIVLISDGRWNLGRILPDQAFRSLFQCIQLL